MSTYKDYRRENLLALERKFGSLEALSDAVGVSASYLSQMKKVRHMGDRVARRFEKKLGLQSGVMDFPPDGAAERLSTGGGSKMPVPHFSPDQSVQELLNDFLGIPPGLRGYVRRKVRELKAYSDQITPFQRNNFPEPPADPAGYAAWERELDAELLRFREEVAERRPPRAKERVK